MAFSTPNPSTTAQSQVVLRNSVQPSTRSWTTPAVGAEVRFGSLTGSSRTAATSQVAASAASAQPGPTPTTRSAAIVGPSTISAPRTIESSTLADWSWARGTSCGIIPCIAGKDAADDVPLTASMTTRCQSSACPVITRYAASPCDSAEIALETWMTRRRSTRSAITPPSSRKTTIGTLRAASTWPRAVALSSMASTAKASAIGAIIEPAMLTAREAKK